MVKAFFLLVAFAVAAPSLPTSLSPVTREFRRLEAPGAAVEPLELPFRSAMSDAIQDVRRWKPEQQAANMLRLVRGNFVLAGKTENRLDGSFLYVVTLDGRIILGKEITNVVQHSTLGGRTAILSAGMMRFENGKLISVDNHSGHYLPQPKRLAYTLHALERLGAKVDGLEVMTVEEVLGQMTVTRMGTFRRPKTREGNCGSPFSGLVP
jgi:hypothetical protein